MTMLRTILTVAFATALSGCVAPAADLSDPRAKSLLALPPVQYYAERHVAGELVKSCAAYKWNAPVDSALESARTAVGAGASVVGNGALNLETSIKRRSLIARYDGVSYATIDPCAALENQTARMTPLSVFAVKGG